MIWPDVPIFIRDYSNGIKKLDDNSEEILKKKIKYNPNAFHLNPLSDDFGLDEKYTIRPFNLHTSSSLKDLFKNRYTPSNTLKGSKVNLSTGTKEIIKMTEKMIPKIDHSTIDPRYYENKMNKIHSNEDLMLREMSKADAFAKGFIANLKPVTLGGGGDGPINLEPSPAPTSTPSRSTRLNMTDEERTEKNKRILTGGGLSINPLRKSSVEDFESELKDAEDKFNEIMEGQEDESKQRKRDEKINNFQRLAGKNYGKSVYEELQKGAQETRERRGVLNKAASKITSAIRTIGEQKKTTKR